MRSLEEQWNAAQKRLEQLMAELPEIEECRRALQRSALGWDVVHHASRRSSAWELSGQLQQRLSTLPRESDEHRKFDQELQRQHAILAQEEAQIAALLKKGSFANKADARDARLSEDRVTELQSRVDTFTDRYQSALELCLELDALLDRDDSTETSAEIDAGSTSRQ